MLGAKDRGEVRGAVTPPRDRHTILNQPKLAGGIAGNREGEPLIMMAF